MRFGCEHRECYFYFFRKMVAAGGVLLALIICIEFLDFTIAGHYIEHILSDTQEMVMNLISQK